MKNSFTLTASLLLGLGSLSAQTESVPLGIQSGATGPQSFLTSDQTRHLTLCTYEICRPNADGKLEILPIAAGSASALLAQASVPDSEDYLVFYPNERRRDPDSRLILRHRYLIKIAEGADLSAIQSRCGMKSLKPLRPGSNLVVCTEESSGKVLSQLSRVEADPEIESVEPLFAKKRYKRIVPTDPFYDLIDRDGFDDGSTTYQWYLNNVGANGGLTGIDIRFEEATNVATGNGVTVAIIDDGVAVDHEDLVANATGPNLNIIESTDDVVSEEPGTLDPLLNHGTNVAGLLAAAANNDLGISGAAPDATLSSIVLLGQPFDDADEASALGFSPNEIDIYNSSFGPNDAVFALEGPGLAATEALLNGVTNGRVVDGTPLGNIYVWAGGNGGLIGDNSNYDGYANSRYTIAVGAVSDNGIKARFSEKGANLVVSAPSGGGSQDMVTTSFIVDLNEDGELVRLPEYDRTFSGTSAATPLVSATVALMLDENPDLTWRDVQDILIRSAVKIDSNNGGWSDNGAGLHFSHSYGAGLVNAEEAVKMAGGTSLVNNWVPLGAAGTQTRSRLYSDAEGGESGRVPDNTGESLISEFDFSVDDDGNAAENLLVEHVEFQARIITESRSDLEIVVISPSGTQSILQESNFENDEQSINNWRFMTTHNWGEGSAGKWLIRITDTTTGKAAVVNNALLTVHGSPNPDAPIVVGPVLTSTRNVITDQGRMLNYNVETTINVTNIEVGDLPPGLDYDPTRRLIFGSPTTPGIYQVPVTLTDGEGQTGETGITIVIRPTSVALGDAIGFSGIPAIFGGNLPWDFDFNDTNDAPSVPVEERQSVSSNIDLVDNESSIFGFDGLGEGVLLFDWKVFSEEGFDRLWFNRGQGDVPQYWDGFISGDRDWGRAAVLLPDASNDVRFIYTKDATNSEGEDRGLVDNLEMMSIEKYREEVTRAGNIKGFDYELNSRMLFIPAELFGASPPDEGGEPSALISPAIGNGQTASLSGWVEGPGRFSFIVINFAEETDVFEFVLDGVVVTTGPGLGSAGGAPVLLLEDRAIPEGRHLIELRFRKNFSGSDAATFDGSVFDGVLLDNVSFTPDENFGAFMGNQTGNVDNGVDGDPDGDGYSNHLEYAFGGDWLVSDVPRYLPQVVIDGDRSFIEYGVDTSKSDLTYTAQQSSDLNNWTDASLSSMIRVEGSVEIYRIPVLSGPGRRNLFYRVIAEAK